MSCRRTAFFSKGTATGSRFSSRTLPRSSTTPTTTLVPPDHSQTFFLPWVEGFFRVLSRYSALRLHVKRARLANASACTLNAMEAFVDVYCHARRQPAAIEKRRAPSQLRDRRQSRFRSECFRVAALITYHPGDPSVVSNVRAHTKLLCDRALLASGLLQVFRSGLLF